MVVSADLTAEISALLTRPRIADLEFSQAGATVGEVYAMAAWLRASLPGKKRGAVCLATEDRAVIAAALLASLAGGPTLLLPYAFSGQALSGLQQATGFAVAISDRDRDFPPGTELILPKRGDSGPDLSNVAVDPHQELLRLYTGGSTGLPQIWSKTGVNIFAESLFLAGHFAVSPGDRILATISPYHIYGLLYSITLPLVSGAAVVPETPSFPEEIMQAVEDYQATILVSVPAHYRALRGKPAVGSTLRLAFSSAGALEAEVNSAFCRNNLVEIVEIYGSTETGGIALRNSSRGEEQFSPYPTVDWKINDQQLLVRSPYLSPDLTRDANGFFTAGDRVEVCGPSGFSLKGRADLITKVAGNRVDLEEITAFVKQQPGITDCLVLALAEGGGRQHRIVALIEGGDVNVEALKKTLASRFEPYALPKTIKTVARMPMKENGKYDREKILRFFGQ